MISHLESLSKYSGFQIMSWYVNRMPDDSFFKKPLMPGLAEKEVNCLIKWIQKAVPFKKNNTAR